MSYKSMFDYVLANVHRRPTPVQVFDNTRTTHPTSVTINNKQHLHDLRAAYNNEHAQGTRRENCMGHALNVNVFAQLPVTVNDELTLNTYMEGLGYRRVLKPEADQATDPVNYVYVFLFDGRDFHFCIERRDGQSVVVTDKPGEGEVRQWSTVIDCASGVAYGTSASAPWLRFVENV